MRCTSGLKSVQKTSLCVCVCGWVKQIKIDKIGNDFIRCKLEYVCVCVCVEASLASPTLAEVTPYYVEACVCGE